MVATVAVLSDIHGVLPVLDAVLAEPDVAAAERIVVTGDHAAGPMPVEVLDRLVGLGDRCLLVRGNADRELVDGRPRPRLRDRRLQLGRAPAAARPGRPARPLPHPVRLDVAGFGTVVFCHGTPRDDDEVVLVDTRLARWAEVLADLDDADRVVVCGHTHMPFARLVDRRLVVNSGSIGMPYGRAGGSWALLRDGQVELRHTAIDVEAAVAAVVAGSAYPDRQAWADEYVRSANSDADAVAAFGPRDGRSADR